MNLKSAKIKFGFCIALALAFLIALGAFFGITLARADRNVTISGSSIFVTSSNAEVWAHKDGTGDTAKDYTMFAFTDNDDAVNYRKNLAYKWIENTAEQDAKPTDENAELPAIKFEENLGWFNMEIGFVDENNKDGKLQFEKFVLTFESQQYSQTKDGKSTNYIIFVNDNGSLKAYIAHKGTADKDLDAVLSRLSDSELLGAVNSDHINIKFTNYENGNYTVEISDGTNTYNTGKFENVGKTYAKYSSSTTTPVTPLSFKAIFAKEAEDGDIDAHGNAFMTLYKLNNQSFALTGASDNGNHLSGGRVNDDTPPVLCLDKAVPFIKYNGEITFDYTVIDVFTSSPSLTTSYYMLTKDAVTAGTSPVYKEEGGDYKKVSDSDDQYIFPHGNHYIPQAGDYSASIYTEDFEVKAAVKVVLKLTDTTSTGGQTTYIPLDWYVNDDNLIKLGGDSNKAYIAVATDKLGATYAYNSYDTTNSKWKSDPDSMEWKDKLDAYKTEVEKAAKDLKAGSKNYFYLPSVESLLADNATAYSDLTFSIYYNNGSQQQATGKSANGLSINLTKAGKYVFTVYAKDAAGNNMYYYDENGEKTEFEASEIWNMYKQEDDTEYAGMKKYLPWFEFTVEESEISIEDPDEQSTAYVDSSFTPDSFEINGVSVKTVYTLYEFQNDLWAKDHDGAALTYKEFSEQKDTLLQENRKYFTRIRPTSELKEGTADYEKFNGYGWNGSSLNFTPQTANAFYIIRCEASSSETAEPVTKLMTIAAAPKVEPLKGEDTWVQDNVTSIVLLCIAGASLVGIVLLLVIKPKNKGDIDEVVEATKKKKSK